MLFGYYELCSEYPIIRRRRHVRRLLPESASLLTLVLYESARTAPQESDRAKRQILINYLPVQPDGRQRDQWCRNLQP